MYPSLQLLHDNKPYVCSHVACIV